MPAMSAILLGLQSIPLTLFGLTTLISPAAAGFEDLPSSVIHTIGMVGLSLGVTYIVTSFQSRRARHWFLIAATLMRFLGAALFLGDGNRGTVFWDAGNAVVNLVVVLWETRSRKGD